MCGLNIERVIKTLFLSTLLLIYGSASIHAQIINTIDSLKRQVRLNKSAAVQVDLFNQLAFEHYDYNDSIGIDYALKALRISTEIKYEKGLKMAHTMVGIGHFSFGEYEAALKEFIKSENRKVADSYQHSVYNLNLMGNILTDIGHYDSAYLIFKQAEMLAFNQQIETELSYTYKGLARLYILKFDKKQTLEYLKKAEQFRLKLNNANLRDIYLTYARAFIEFKEFGEAEKYTFKLCDSLNDSGLVYYKAYCNFLRSRIYYNQGNYSQALNYGFEALSQSEIYSYPYLRIQILSNLGEIYSDLSEFQLGVKYYLKALILCEKTGLKPFYSDILINLAWIEKDQKNYKQSLAYLDRAQKISESIQDQRGISTSHNVRGLVYLLQREFRKSEQELLLARTIRLAINYEFGAMNTLFNLALLYKEQGQLERALSMQLEAMQIDLKYNQPQSLSMTYNAIAGILIDLNRLDEAHKYVKLATDHAYTTGSLILIRNSILTTSKYYEALSDYPRSLAYLKQYQFYNDSIFNESSQIKIAEMQALYQVERKENEIQLLNKDKELVANQLALRESQIRNQYVVIVVGSLLFIVLSGSIFSVIRLNKRLTSSKNELAEANEELQTQSEELTEANQSLSGLYEELQAKQEEIQAQSEELTEANFALSNFNEELQKKQDEIAFQASQLQMVNDEINFINKNLELKIQESVEQLRQAYKELDTFFYHASHDFRRPITTFLGLAEVANISVKDPLAIELFSKVKITAQNLDKMILKLQLISELSSLELAEETIDVYHQVNQIHEDIKPILKENNVQFVLECSKSIRLNTISTLFKSVISLLLENAIDFKGPINSWIKVNVENQESGISIQVEDNGQGISTEYADRIYDMYFRANETSKGNGLGLYIVKRAIGRMGGTIEMHSVQAHGTNFTVYIPQLT